MLNWNTSTTKATGPQQIETFKDIPVRHPEGTKTTIPTASARSVQVDQNIKQYIRKGYQRNATGEVHVTSNRNRKVETQCRINKLTHQE
ncbi:hypothetical protein [Enterobacter hormaechei]|uniref:hypothetical protein n=1 Tax=Enterobacter hormaechei TaxID=158836 RepID=UPI002E17E044|nr:hypothetical protein [Enterobacter hormaechei]